MAIILDRRTMEIERIRYTLDIFPLTYKYAHKRIRMYVHTRTYICPNRHTRTDYTINWISQGIVDTKLKHLFRCRIDYKNDLTSKSYYIHVTLRVNNIDDSRVISKITKFYKNHHFAIDNAR